MEMQALWLIIGFSLIFAELLIGTLHSLMLGIAALVGGVLAWFGVGVYVQFLGVALVAGLLWFGLWQWRSSFRGHEGESTSESLEVGHEVQLLSYEGSVAKVQYRGAVWQARILPNTDLSAPLWIKEQHANTLWVSN